MNHINSFFKKYGQVLLPAIPVGIFVLLIFVGFSQEPDHSETKYQSSESILWDAQNEDDSKMEQNVSLPEENSCSNEQDAGSD